MAHAEICLSLKAATVDAPCRIFLNSSSTILRVISLSGPSFNSFSTELNRVITEESHFQSIEMFLVSAMASLLQLLQSFDAEQGLLRLYEHIDALRKRLEIELIEFLIVLVDVVD